MTGETRIPAMKITGAYEALVKVAARKMVGRVPDSIGVMWNNKAVMKGAMGIGRKVEGWHELDPNLASYAAMASAATIGCSFCLDFNYFMAHNHGLDESKVREVTCWREAAGRHGRGVGWRA
ncbi:carboxymuconolactone decarboxylase family protein [Arthrobacter dokdonensis]|uniref:carboxymuconolactone decarboxylase family protein n=1 Tax=Arthrobacter dokdonellae TaxID=2211210 RepID=UPI000DE58682|nr:carboxymuconolactone decarboxylase family protein [Arthrobacter dokdonellae]